MLEKLGCFGLVLEKIPAHLAQKVANSIAIPVIGIGAGGGVDGQVLVIHDMLGMNNEFSPRFLRRYLNLYEQMTTAIGNYVADVKSSDFPNEKEQY
jgi:3-methyl-2-oxobutanoate hydroxymethyltransferase